ncbi:DUF2997 domain-containing protein [Luteococcus sanguinis]|uniref:DUF2997 domain-containing protein n=1 Tax=Luteococcus sanguinis TaxID=174038 RepID=A0ABW1WWL9_9ACTN
MKRLTVTIRPDGSILADAQDRPGPSCLEAIDDLKRMTGGQIVESRATASFYGTETEQVDQLNLTYRQDLA